MKTKDLKPGMLVALKASSYDPNAHPDKYVVMSLEHTTRDRYSSRLHREEKGVTLTVTSEEGEEVSITSPNIRPLIAEKSPPRIVLANQSDKGKWSLGQSVPGQIEGPWAEIAAQRKKDREASARYRAEKKARDDAARKRMSAVLGRLHATGVKVHVRTTVFGSQITMDIEQAEALADMLEGKS